MRKNNKDEIVAAARSLFLKHGYNGISMRAIAREANLTTGAVYFHFKNKKEIYTAICLEAIEFLIAKLKNGVEKKENVNQKLISTFDSYIEFFRENNEYYNILMESKSAYESGEADQDDEVLSRLGKVMTIPTGAIEEGVSGKEFRELDASMLSLFLAAIAEGMLQYKKLGLFDYYGINDRDFRKFMADIIWNGIQRA